MIFNYDKEFEKRKKEHWTFEKLLVEMRKREVKTLNEALEKYKEKIVKVNN